MRECKDGNCHEDGDGTGATAGGGGIMNGLYKQISQIDDQHWSGRVVIF
jgi:hypothetical protein